MTRQEIAFLIGILIVLLLVAVDAVVVLGWVGLLAAPLLLIPYGLFVFRGLNIVPEYERMVIFRLGKCVGARGPGIVWVIPFLEHPISVDLRERFHEVSHEACITKDNAKIDVDFLFYWKVVNPVWSQTRVQKLEVALEGLATGLLRAVIGLFQLDEALAQRERINEELKDELEEVSEHWGVTVTTVEIREIVPPKDIQDAMHRQLAAERDRRAVILEAQAQRENAILRAEGEAWALERLYRAAKEIDPKTLQIKYLTALTELGKSNSTKYIFPLEFTQLIKPFAQSPTPELGNGDSGTNAQTISKEELLALLKKVVESLSDSKPAPDETNSAAALPPAASPHVPARFIPPLDEKAA
jgi:regulator of protease activity HflC (stomatin/prohibitin superfamily)